MKSETPMRATVEGIEPSYRFDFLPLQANGGAAPVVIAPALDDLVNCVSIPTPVISGELPRLHECLRTDWPPIDPDISEPAGRYGPIYVSAGKAWVRGDTRLEVFDRAVVLEGRARIAAAVRSGAPLSAIVFFNLDEDQELRHRRALVSTHSAARTAFPEATRASDRIVVTYPNTQNLLVRSDPYVIATVRGYACAIDVSPLRSPNEMFYVLCSPRSLATPLEELRRREGSLIGSLVQISRQGPRRTDPYLVTEL
jgi:hypothetical protein